MAEKRLKYQGLTASLSPSFKMAGSAAALPAILKEGEREAVKRGVRLGNTSGLRSRDRRIFYPPYIVFRHCCISLDTRYIFSESVDDTRIKLAMSSSQLRVTTVVKRKDLEFHTPYRAGPACRAAC